MRATSWERRAKAASQADWSIAARAALSAARPAAQAWRWAAAADLAAFLASRISARLWEAITWKCETQKERKKRKKKKKSNKSTRELGKRWSAAGRKRREGGGREGLA